MAPNVVLVTVDCLRYDRCGWNGYHLDTTPNLLDVARESFVFDAAVAPGPRTSESVPGILAGVLSCDCPYHDEVAYKALPSPTLASWLKVYGYSTAAVVANPQLSPSRGFDRGFDSFRNLRIERTLDRFGKNSGDDGRLPFARVAQWFRERLRADNWRDGSGIVPLVLYRLYQKRMGWPTSPGADVVDAFVSTIDGIETPFFAWTHLNDLHAPLDPGRVRDGGLLDAGDVAQFRWDARRIGRRHEPRYGAMYDSTVRYVDTQIGRLVDSLRDLGMWDDTVLVVTADHGEALFDRGVYGHAAGSDRFEHDPLRDYMYEELLHVPLLVRTPDDRRGRIERPFSLAWLHELVSEVGDVPTGEFPRTSGSSRHLPPSGELEKPVVSDAISEAGHTVAVRNGARKAVLAMRVADDDPQPLHFDLDADPTERRPLDRVERDIEDAGSDLLVHPDSLRSLDERVDERTRELLAQLGYR